MASLYTSVSLAVIRLIIVKQEDKFWLKEGNWSCSATIVLTMTWFLALATSIPPVLGIGQFGQDTVGVR